MRAGLVGSSWRAGRWRSAAGEDSLETEGAGGDDTRFAEHVELLRAVLAGEERLGRKPEERAEVVTELALGAPGDLGGAELGGDGVLGARGCGGATAGGGDGGGGTSDVVRPTDGDGGGAARRGCAVLAGDAAYAIAGCLQAVLDEHF